MLSIRTALIRVAAKQPEIRPYILRILMAASTVRRPGTTWRIQHPEAAQDPSRVHRDESVTIIDVVEEFSPRGPKKTNRLFFRTVEDTETSAPEWAFEDRIPPLRNPLDDAWDVVKGCLRKAGLGKQFKAVGTSGRNDRSMMAFGSVPYVDVEEALIKNHSIQLKSGYRYTVTVQVSRDGDTRTFEGYIFINDYRKVTSISLNS